MKYLTSVQVKEYLYFILIILINLSEFIVLLHLKTQVTKIIEYVYVYARAGTKCTFT